MLLIVTDALMPSADGYALHPALSAHEKTFHTYTQTWFESEAMNPLSLYAQLSGESPASLLAKKIGIQAAQYWVASPYHGQLTRDAVRVLPERMLQWGVHDAQWLCDALNPLLAEENMALRAIDSALLLCCEQALQASPMPFASIAGQYLPNRHPEGIDGGRLMRLMAEIQMQLKQTPCTHRREAGDVDIHGLWFWGSSMHKDKRINHPFSVATRNPYLQPLVDAQDAQVILTEADDLEKLIKQDVKGFKYIYLAGNHHVLGLRKTYLPNFRKKTWQPKSVQGGRQYIQCMLDCMYLNQPR